MKVIRKGPAPVEVECGKCKSLLSVTHEDVQSGSGSGVIVCAVCHQPMASPFLNYRPAEAPSGIYDQGLGMTQTKMRNWAT